MNIRVWKPIATKAPRHKVPLRTALYFMFFVCAFLSVFEFLWQSIVSEGCAMYLFPTVLQVGTVLFEFFLLLAFIRQDFIEIRLNCFVLRFCRRSVGHSFGSVRVQQVIHV